MMIGVTSLAARRRRQIDRPSSPGSIRSSTIRSIVSRVSRRFSALPSSASRTSSPPASGSAAAGRGCGRRRRRRRRRSGTLVGIGGAMGRLQGSRNLRGHSAGNPGRFRKPSDHLLQILPAPDPVNRAILPAKTACACHRRSFAGSSPATGSRRSGHAFRRPIPPRRSSPPPPLQVPACSRSPNRRPLRSRRGVVQSALKRALDAAAEVTQGSAPASCSCTNKEEQDALFPALRQEPAHQRR